MTTSTTTPASVTPRQTQNCKDIEQVLQKMGHASNTEILDVLRKSNPGLSATTVHRATSRLALRGVIAVAPPNIDGSMRYDANTDPHDHFTCTSCGMLRDTDIKDQVIPILESRMDDCVISGRLTISGQCKNCINKENIR